MSARLCQVRGLRWDDDVQPTLAELERFKAGMGVGADEELLSAVKSTGRGSKAHFGVGDTVKVIDGDLKHLTGTVQAISTGRPRPNAQTKSSEPAEACSHAVARRHTPSHAPLVWLCGA